MRISVTGSTGFIGKYLIPALAAKGHDLRLLVREGRQDAVPEVQGGSVELHVGDLLKPETIKGFLKDTDLLIHMAAAHDHVEDELMRNITVGGTEALLADAVEQGRIAPTRFASYLEIMDELVPPPEDEVFELPPDVQP